MGLKDSSGSKKVPGLCSDTAYEFDGTAILQKNKLISPNQEFKTASIFSTFKLAKDNDGYLFTTYFSDATPMMALRMNPLTFEYTDNDTPRAVHSTKIRGNTINDGKWHTLAIAIGEKTLEVLVDCVSVTRVAKPKKFELSDLLKNEGLTLLGSRLDGNTKFEVSVSVSVGAPGRGGEGRGLKFQRALPCPCNLCCREGVRSSATDKMSDIFVTGWDCVISGGTTKKCRGGKGY